MRILLIEDDASISEFIVTGLTKLGYEVERATEGRKGISLALAADYDLILLDLILPDVDGIEVLRQLRGAGRATRVLLLTTRNEVEQRVAGLDAGADDYLGKPFEFSELLARVRSLLRRTPLDFSASAMRVGDLELDTRRRYVTRGGRELRLPAKQFAILEHLLRNANQVVTRQDLARVVWSAEPSTSNNVIDVTVHLLRENVDRDFPTPLIHTVRGIGYRLSTEQSRPGTELVPAQGENSSQPKRSAV